MDIQAILALHKEYLETNRAKGARAELRGANLSGANLSWANLSGANLQIGNFHRWHYTATSRDLRIGCQLHTWADWKAKGAAIAKEYDCAAEFKAFWPVLDATRKNLQKRFPTK